MINGAHVIISSTDSEADRAFLRDVLALPFVDVGHGWLIFGLPPSEVAVHPGDKNGQHALYLMCADVELLVREMTALGVACGPITNQGWGMLTELTLPGGGKLGVYEPRHARPPAPSASVPRARAKRSAPRNAASRKPATKKPAITKPAIKKPAIKKPAIKTPVAKAGKGKQPTGARKKR
jgi:hypothetical protein